MNKISDAIFDILSVLCGLLLAQPVFAESKPAKFPEAYNIVWTTQSRNSGDSMPVSGGDIGLNVWVENNELMLYISRAGCRDENGALLKIGRVRIDIQPNPFTEGFRQELKLQQGYAEISGTGANGGSVKVWVEVNRPIIHIEANTKQPVSITSTYESWRTKDRVLKLKRDKTADRAMCMVTFDAYPGTIKVRKDTIETVNDCIRFYHRIPGNSFLFDFTVKQQQLEAVKEQLWNPLKHLTWGGMMMGRNFAASRQTSGTYGATAFKGWSITSKQPARQQKLKMVLFTDQSEAIDGWKEGLCNLAAESDDKQAWQDNLAWWQQFWERSYIVINPGANDTDSAWSAGRNYNLFRYMLASNIHGREPTMFNGGLFTFDPVFVNSRKFTPDYRQWGASYHAQNQRLVYWPMLKTGDFEMMLPALETYRKGLINAKARVEQSWGHDGCNFVEMVCPTMLPGPAAYGFFEGGRRGRRGDMETGVCANTATKYIYQGQLEFSWMMLQYYYFSGLDIKPYLPLIKQSVLFYDEHYQYRRTREQLEPLSAEGKLIISPSNALEGMSGDNPTSVIAGLTRVLKELCALPPPLNTPEEQKRWKAMLDRLPTWPTGERDGKLYLKPTAQQEHRHAHSPEMYPLYPYDLFGLGRPRLDLMKHTFDNIPPHNREKFASWTQMNIHAARLGYTEEARKQALQKLSNGNKRFPAFFRTGYDWQPDHNWGGSGMIGLQEMLMQTLGNEIRLFPAWPPQWDVEFKLHAPYQTTIEGRVHKGQLVKLNVTPESRRKDVIIVGLQ